MKVPPKQPAKRTVQAADATAELYRLLEAGDRAIAEGADEPTWVALRDKIAVAFSESTASAAG